MHMPVGDHDDIGFMVALIYLKKSDSDVLWLCKQQLVIFIAKLHARRIHKSSRAVKRRKLSLQPDSSYQPMANSSLADS